MEAKKGVRVGRGKRMIRVREKGGVKKGNKTKEKKGKGKMRGRGEGQMGLKWGKGREGKGGRGGGRRKMRGKEDWKRG